MATWDKLLKRGPASSLPEPDTEQDILYALQQEPVAQVVRDPVPAPIPGALPGEPPTGGMSALSPYMDNNKKDAIEAKLYAELAKVDKNPYLDSQQKNADDYMAKVKAYMQNAPEGLAATNLQPLAALADAWSGSKLAQSYTPPETPQDRAKNALTLQAKAVDLQGDVTKQRNDLFKDKLQALVGIDKANRDPLAMMFQQEKIKAANIRAAQSTVDKDSLLTQYTQRIDGAKRGLDQIADVRAGEVGATEQLLNQLNNEVTRLEVGSNVISDNKTESLAFKSYAAHLARLTGQLDTARKTPGADISGPLNEIEALMNGMGKSYTNAVGRRYSHFLSRATPEQKSIYEGAYGQFQKEYPKFGETKKEPNRAPSFEEFKKLKAEGKL